MRTKRTKSQKVLGAIHWTTTALAVVSLALAAFGGFNVITAKAAPLQTVPLQAFSPQGPQLQTVPIVQPAPLQVFQLDPPPPLTCGDNAHVQGNHCSCNDGFEGDPVTGCTPEEEGCPPGTNEQGGVCVPNGDGSGNCNENQGGGSGGEDEGSGNNDNCDEDPPTCGGEGQPACPTCGGEGQPACPTCGGEGQPACPTCGGEGQPACPTCGGEGQPACPTCGGEGQPACPTSGDPDPGPSGGNPGFLDSPAMGWPAFRLGSYGFVLFGLLALVTNKLLRRKEDAVA